MEDKRENSMCKACRLRTKRTLQEATDNQAGLDFGL